MTWADWVRLQVEAVGSQERFGRRVGATQPRVSQWLRGAEPTAKRQRQVVADAGERWEDAREVIERLPKPPSQATVVVMDCEEALMRDRRLSREWREVLLAAYRTAVAEHRPPPGVRERRASRRAG